VRGLGGWEVGKVGGILEKWRWRGLEVEVKWSLEGLEVK